jgi:Cd2+/Zn2+-exporting ATPase
MLRNLNPSGGFTEDELLTAAAAGEAASSHPIALSLLSAAEKRLPEELRESAVALRAVKGRGVEGEWRGASLLIGKVSWLEEKGIVLETASPSGGSEEGGTLVHLAWDGIYRGSLLLADRLRSGASASLEALRATGVKRIEMLTGDDEAAARSAASSLPLDGFHASLLPEGKVAVLEEAALRGGRTLFVGDGINDAPVLARADVGIAMGGLGSDAAIEAADVVLMSDDLGHLATARRIARKTRTIVVQNIVTALGIKAVILALAAAGYAGMGLAVFGDVGVALLAVLNVLRIMSDREPTSPSVS